MCNGEGEILSRWAAGADSGRIRCPRCFRLGWVQRSLGLLRKDHPPTPKKPCSRKRRDPCRKWGMSIPRQVGLSQTARVRPYRSNGVPVMRNPRKIGRAGPRKLGPSRSRIRLKLTTLLPTSAPTEKEQGVKHDELETAQVARVRQNRRNPIALSLDLPESPPPGWPPPSPTTISTA